MTPTEVLVLGGPPAAGKTTVAALIADRWNPSVHLGGDAFWETFIRRGYLKPWRPESREQNSTVIRVVMAAAAEYAGGGYSVVVDATVGPWFLELVADVFSDRGVDWHYAILLPTHASVVERNGSRSPGEGVEEEVLEKMYAEFTSHLRGFEEHAVDSTRMSAEETAAAVCAKLERGELRLQ
jgi:chloramphenicol 3-O-phosphotransferase